MFKNWNVKKMPRKSDEHVFLTSRNKFSSKKLNFSGKLIQRKNSKMTGLWEYIPFFSLWLEEHFSSPIAYATRDGLTAMTGAGHAPSIQPCGVPD